ncbi:MAG: acetyl-CoA hydrolase/transferase family protein [Acidobacteriaceae bacterium]
MSKSVNKLLQGDRLADVVSPGQTVFIPGGVAVPVDFLQDLQNRPDQSRGLKLLTSIAPGIDLPLDVERLDPSATVSGLFMQPALSKAQRDGRYRHLPMSYGGFVRYLSSGVDLDLSVLQVTEPDSEGNCSLGPSVEFLPIALRRSRRLLALINSRLPRMPGAPSISLDQFDYLGESVADLPEYGTDTDAPTLAIARQIAALIGNGSALQMGLGKVPTALSAALCEHRNLRLFSGMLSDGMMALAEAGALDPRFEHTTCVVAGSRELYRWAPGFSHLRVLGCDVTHEMRNLLGLGRFVAVNSALEVDLLGQCNLEHAEGRAVSGAGGAPDFARAARLSPDGCSIVALSATYKRGTASRIIPCMSGQSISSLSRVDVDCVVTEFGVADLRGGSVHERAQAIISIAAPEFRASLQAAWDDAASRL